MTFVPKRHPISIGEQADRAVTLVVHNFFVLSAIYALPATCSTLILVNYHALRSSVAGTIVGAIGLLLAWTLLAFVLRPIFLVFAAATEGRHDFTRDVLTASRVEWPKHLIALTLLSFVRWTLSLCAYGLVGICGFLIFMIYKTELAEGLPFAAQVALVSALVVFCIGTVLLYIPLKFTEAVAIGVCALERPQMSYAVKKGLRETFARENFRRAIPGGLALFFAEIAIPLSVFVVSYFDRPVTFDWFYGLRVVLAWLVGELTVALTFVIYNANRVRREGLDLSRTVSEWPTS